MSELRAKLRWKVTTVFDTEPPIHQKNILFNISSNTGLYRQFSIPLWHGYMPQVLAPTVTFHQAIRNMLRSSLGVEITDKKFPYTVFVPQIEAEVLLNIHIRLFPPNILSLTVKLSDVPIRDLDAAKLIDYQRLDYLRPISDITQWTIGMAETLNHKDFDPSHPLRFKPAIHLDGICPPEKCQAYFRDNLSKYVGILIRNYDYELMDSRIPAAVLKKNEEHNLKSLQEMLLIDKQGILYLTPKGTGTTTPKRPRFSRTYDLYGLALVFDDYMRHYHGVRLRNEDFADFLLYKIRPWIMEPETVFSASVSNKHIWSLIVDEFSLSARMRSALSQSVQDALAEKSRYFDQFASEWWNESDFAYLIARRVQDSKELQLGFLENEDLKRLITEDFAEARRSFRSRNYKATILLCGSVAEAILTAVIDRAGLPGISTNRLYQDFNLSDLIETAREHGLIRDRTLLLLLEPLRHYRNLIHPGVQMRKSLSPDSSKAGIALEIINLLVKDLNQACS